MNNAMQLKARIKNLAKSKNISAQIILQNYMMERLLERISMSPYKTNFILKGGFLIAAIVGLDTRATMDLDATVRGLAVNAETVNKMFEEICLIPVKDDVNFIIRNTEEIRETADYAGIRVTLEAAFPPMTVPLKVDITSGDVITPREIDYEFRLLLEPRTISVFAYNLETILAEKLETVISRGDQSTRPRDYYDIYIIRSLQWQNIDPLLLGAAVEATSRFRNTLQLMRQYREIIKIVEDSDAMHGHWLKYQNQFDYARDIRFESICATVLEIMDSIALPA